MQGKRLRDGQSPKFPGEYAWVPYTGWDHRPSFYLGEGEWHVVDPTGGVGALGRHWVETKLDGSKVEHRPAHSWVIHEDGTVTFTPSLVMPSGWHGWLRRGVFSTA